MRGKITGGGNLTSDVTSLAVATEAEELNVISEGTSSIVATEAECVQQIAR